MLFVGAGPQGDVLTNLGFRLPLKTLDGFYPVSSQSGWNPYSQQLSEPPREVKGAMAFSLLGLPMQGGVRAVC